MGVNKNYKGKKKATKRRFSRSFDKDDARHYVVYTHLCKAKVQFPFLRAEEIIQALKDSRLL